MSKTIIRNNNGTIKVSGSLTGLEALKLKEVIRIALTEKGIPIVDITNAYPVGFMALHILKDFFGLITIKVGNCQTVLTMIDVLEIDDMVIGS